MVRHASRQAAGPSRVRDRSRGDDRLAWTAHLGHMSAKPPRRPDDNRAIWSGRAGLPHHRLTPGAGALGEPSGGEVMRRLAILVATVAMLSSAPAASAAPPENRVFVIDFSGDVDCDGASLTFHTTGWVNGPFDASHPTNYHLKWVYSNADGESWTYIDTGNIRLFERNGVLFNSLSGRSTNVG